MRIPSSEVRSRRFLVAAISSAAAAALAYVFLREGLAWFEAVVLALGNVLPCTVLSWLVWRKVSSERRRPPPPRTRAFLEHAALGTAFSAAWITAFVAFAWPVRPDIVQAFLAGDATWQFVYGYVIYGAVAAAAYASRTRAQLKERELAVARAELLALRAQLDPHFLFNTLHSLTQLAREDPGATEEALERFGELMRYVLNAGREGLQDAPLEDEIEFVRHYLALESLRLGARLRIVEDLDPDALELAVPPLFLQPLVENAVRHGIAPRRRGGTLRLSARVADDTLAIEVADDGGGAEPDGWREGAGLGLRVVRRQLEARFPGTGGFEVLTSPGQGFAVRLTLPALIPSRRAS